MCPTWEKGGGRGSCSSFQQPHTHTQTSRPTYTSTGCTILRYHTTNTHTHTHIPQVIRLSRTVRYENLRAPPSPPRTARPPPAARRPAAPPPGLTSSTKSVPLNNVNYVPPLFLLLFFSFSLFQLFQTFFNQF